MYTWYCQNGIENTIQDDGFRGGTSYPRTMHTMNLYQNLNRSNPLHPEYIEENSNEWLHIC